MFLMPYVLLHCPAGTTLVVCFVPKVEQNLQASGSTKLLSLLILSFFIFEKVRLNYFIRRYSTPYCTFLRM